ncbi:MAG TPA: ABC transporter substrate-binding protein [Candidatus Eisenbacteria bacterium]|nr:ABC transporter substrate-binding protein [Candidatus Eisenbacteria bacterium]
MRRILIVLFFFVFLGSIVAHAVPAAFAGEPTEQIRSAIDQGIEILRQAKLDDKRQRSETINRLREIVFPLFDFNEMAKRSLGAHWRRLNPQQQKQFVSAFTELLETTYADKIDLYEGQTVAYINESVDKDYAQVATRVIGKNSQAYSVDYKLHRVDGKWKIYDVSAEQISLVNNYRSQFHRVIVNHSFDELLKRIQEKST